MVTAAEAAKLLGVSRRRVAELFRTGDLRGRKLSSGDLSIDVASVHEREFLGAFDGRPWSEDVIWEIVSALSRPSSEVGANVGGRVASTDAGQLGRRITSAVTTRRFHARNSARVRDELHLTGESATDALASPGSAYDRVVGSSRAIHGYAADTERFIQEHELVEDLSGEVVLYRFRSGADRVHAATPIALVGADCLRSANTRIRGAGVDALERMRSAWLAQRTR